ncbi:hypothetical protein C8R44DRAFT_946734 [Mycena epipterygia]|nr:hypothetical protein C8R44DRAFT_946734 [Mycena epipterygia]
MHSDLQLTRHYSFPALTALTGTSSAYPSRKFPILIHAEEDLFQGVNTYRAVKYSDTSGGDWIVLPGAGGGLEHLEKEEELTKNRKPTVEKRQEEERIPYELIMRDDPNPRFASNGWPITLMNFSRDSLGECRSQTTSKDDAWRTGTHYRESLKHLDSRARRAIADD